MKKIYLSLFLTITTLTTSCMERERPKIHHPAPQNVPVFKANELGWERFTNMTYERNWPCITPTGHPLVIFDPNPYSQPIHTNVQPDVNKQQTYDQIVNTNWQKYNEIMDMTYKRDQPVATTNEAQLLTPVYKKQSKSTEQETKPLLLTNSLRPDENMMQSLYNESCRIVCGEYGKRLEQKYQNKKLVRLIQHMNEARNSGIHEDSMGRFAYNKKGIWTINDIDMTPFYPLFFSLLKKYNLTVRETGEQPPLHFGAKKTRLKDILTAPSDTNEQTVLRIQHIHIMTS